MKKWLVGLLVLVLLGGLFIFLRYQGDGSKTLHLFIYANYMEPSVIEQFKKEYGVEVVEENCSSNEEVESKLKAGASGYDIITPSDYVVKRFLAKGLLAKLDRSQIPNLKHLSERFQKPAYDPTGSWTVPYMWGTTGIGYNKKFVTDPPRSWAQLFDPAWLAKWNKRVSFLDDPREVIGAALKVGGKSINDASPEALAQAKDRLLSMLPHISRIDSTSYKDLLASGDLWVVHGYSGDVLKVRENNPDIAFVIPVEGATIWSDNLAIPAQSLNKELAHQFIDFVMRPEINAKIAAHIHYASTNGAARALLPANQVNDPGIYPGPALQKKLEWFQDPGDKADAFDELWNEVRNWSGPVEAQPGTPKAG